MFEPISYNDFVKKIAKNKSTFLCGNGFSINFDRKFSTSCLSSSLYSTHCHLKSFQHYDVIANNNYKEMMLNNYKCTKSVINKINTESDFVAFFYDAVNFAHAIVDDLTVLNWLEENNYNLKMTFGLQQLDLVKEIVFQADNYGALSVNYEYWTVLIYYALALKNAPVDIFVLDVNNKFVKAVLAGNSISQKRPNSINNGMEIFGEVVTNGMHIYLRLLFSSNILLCGDSVNVQKLENWNLYSIDTVDNFLANFDYLMTTNYDLLLEKITQRNVYHLHGGYTTDKKRVLYESLGVTYNGVRYDLSTIIVGDYFLAKSFYQITAKLASKNMINSQIQIYADMIKEILCDGKSNVVVIFGLGVDNDYHILRDIQVQLEAGNTNNPHIIYCYYSDQDKNKFIESYQKCITYSNQLSEYVKNEISVSVIDSKEIIDKLFVSSGKI